MKITITGSLGNIGKHLAKSLIAGGNTVTVISSNDERKTSIESLGATAAIGSITDTAFLTRTFADSEAVFVMTPPNLGGQDFIKNTINAGKSYAAAIKASGVKRVVMLSSVGADFENGTGPIEALHHIEKIYGELKDVSTTYLRAGYFFFNLLNNISMIKSAGFMGSNFPPETKLPAVHPFDIASAAAEELQLLPEGQNIRYVVGDYVSASQVAQAIGSAIGKPELDWVEFTDLQSFQGMSSAGLPDEAANLYTELGAGIRNGRLQSDFEAQGAPVYGKIKLKDFALDFAEKFKD